LRSRLRAFRRSRTSLGPATLSGQRPHPRIRVNAFNHASTAFGESPGPSKHPPRQQALDEAGLTQDRVRDYGRRQSLLLLSKIAGAESGGPQKKSARLRDYDLTFPASTRSSRRRLPQVWSNFEPRVLPCGHYTTAKPVQIHRCWSWLVCLPPTKPPR